MHTILYQSEDGQQIKVTVPWGPHSGNIPPPVLSFFRQGQDYLIFYYQGSLD